VTTDEAPAAPNNPAGRVLAFMREFQATIQQVTSDNAMLVLMKILGEQEQESSRIYLLMTRLRMQAELVPDLMTPYEGAAVHRSATEYPRRGSANLIKALYSVGRPGWEWTLWFGRRPSL
jgi:hypothetical protein